MGDSDIEVALKRGKHYGFASVASDLYVSNGTSIELAFRSKAILRKHNRPWSARHRIGYGLFASGNFILLKRLAEAPAASRHSKAATEVYIRIDHVAAHEYCQKAQQEWSNAKKLHANATKEILAIKNCENDDWTLNLHGLRNAL
ncbi:putative SMR domain-containing protein [Tanacetum coccineum]